VKTKARKIRVAKTKRGRNKRRTDRKRGKGTE